MKKIKSFMLFTATMLLLAVILCFNASAAEWLALGDNHFYSFDKETGIMVIKGEGELSSALFGLDCPEHYKRNDYPDKCFCDYSEFDSYFPPELEFEKPELYEAYCAALKTKTLIIQEGTSSVATSTFYNFARLETVILPQSVTEISAGAFWNLRHLHTVALSYSTTSIGASAFAGCHNLRNIYLSETVNTIAKDAFAGCDKNSIRIPESVKNADELEFFGGKTELSISKREGNKVYLKAKYVDHFVRTEFYSYDKAANKYTKIGEDNSTSVIADNLEPGKTYYFVARNYISTDSGRLYYDKSEILTVEMAPEKVSKVTSKSTATSVTLDWTKSEGADGYRVYQKTASGWKSLGTTSKLSGTIKNLQPGTTYKFVVRPYADADGTKLWGTYDEISASTAPETPVVKVSSPSKGKATVTWGEAKGAQKYQLYYKVGNGSYKLYKTYDNAQNLTFKNLKSGTKYTFAVRAYWLAESKYYYSAYTPVTVAIK